MVVNSHGSSGVEANVWLWAGRDGETKGKRNEQKREGNASENGGIWRDTALVVFCRKLSY
jgi:hypothetical protein